MEKTYEDFLEFMLKKYSAEPEETVSLKDIREFLIIDNTTMHDNEYTEDSCIDLLSPEVRDFLRHYPNTAEDIGNKRYVTDIVICDKCGNRNHIITHISGEYEVYDRNWNDCKVDQALLVPQKITSISDAREVFYFYENLVE